MTAVAILLVATGRYKEFVPVIYEDIRDKLFPDASLRRLVVCTDAATPEALGVPAKFTHRDTGAVVEVVVHPIQRRGFPGDTLFRYHYFASCHDTLWPSTTFAFALYMDVDMRVLHPTHLTELFADRPPRGILYDAGTFEPHCSAGTLFTADHRKVDVADHRQAVADDTLDTLLSPRAFAATSSSEPSSSSSEPSSSSSESTSWQGFAVTHPGFARNAERPWGTPETNKFSEAYLAPGPRPLPYVCGGVQGGRTEWYARACAEMRGRIDRDLAHGIVPVWHDESVWNKYACEHADQLRLFSPSLCYSMQFAVAWKLTEWVPWICTVEKNHAYFRANP